MYLFFLGTIFTFTACIQDQNTTEEVTSDIEETAVACGDDCQKSCCLGCKATKGDAKCIVLEDGSMPCCIAKSSEEDHDHEEHGHNH